MSDIDYCSCDYDDWDPSPFINVRKVQHARKAFSCCECGGPILIGEPYRSVAGKWSGDLETFRTCSLCLELEEWATISVPCFCSNVMGELHERVGAMVKDVSPKVPGFFMEYGRRMVKINRRLAANAKGSGNRAQTEQA